MPVVRKFKKYGYKGNIYDYGLVKISGFSNTFFAFLKPKSFNVLRKEKNSKNRLSSLFQAVSGCEMETPFLTTKQVGSLLEEGLS
jgi:hypothetical protein